MIRPKQARAGRAPLPASAARALFDAREIKKLVSLMEESGLLELEIESAGDKVRLVRAGGGTGGGVPLAPRRSSVRDADHGVPPDARAITSPMVGTFHRAPAVEAPPFVEVGGVVERGQVLCLVEAMKMMNEIEAEFRGRVKQVLIENGRPVEYGEALFLIEPL